MADSGFPGHLANYFPENCIKMKKIGLKRGRPTSANVLWTEIEINSKVVLRKCSPIVIFNIIIFNKTQSCHVCKFVRLSLIRVGNTSQVLFTCVLNTSGCFERS